MEEQLRLGGPCVAISHSQKIIYSVVDGSLGLLPRYVVTDDAALECHIVSKISVQYYSSVSATSD